MEGFLFLINFNDVKNYMSPRGFFFASWTNKHFFRCVFLYFPSGKYFHLLLTERKEKSQNTTLRLQSVQKLVHDVIMVTSMFYIEFMVLTLVTS